MNRWGARIMALIMLLIFMMLFLNLKKQLTMLQRTHNPPAAPAQVK